MFDLPAARALALRATEDADWVDDSVSREPPELAASFDTDDVRALASLVEQMAQRIEELEGACEAAKTWIENGSSFSSAIRQEDVYDQLTAALAPHRRRKSDH